jgi:hypothetical protein
MPAETCPSEWLREPISLDVIEAKLCRHADHPGWQRVLRQARPGDEFWWFRSPSHTWPRKVGAAGYALVRAGSVVATFTVARS